MTAFMDGTRNGRRTGWVEKIHCFTCHGAGEISEEHVRLIEEGERLRADRIARGLSLREEAARLGCPPRELSDREQGKIPDGGLV